MKNGSIDEKVNMPCIVNISAIQTQKMILIGESFGRVALIAIFLTT